MDNNNLFTAPAGAAMLIIYQHYITINRRAMDILGITRGAPYVHFQLTDRGYVSISGTVSPSGNRVHIRNHGGRVCSTAVAHWLSRHLQGPGTYRIVEEYQVHNPTGEQRPCYEIFFRKYQNLRNNEETETTQRPDALEA